jgi:hypothetical protein
VGGRLFVTVVLDVSLEMVVLAETGSVRDLASGDSFLLVSGVCGVEVLVGVADVIRFEELFFLADFLALGLLLLFFRFELDSFFFSDAGVVALDDVD